MNLLYSASILFLFGLTAVTNASPVKDSGVGKECAACQLVSHWHQTIGNRPAKKCSEQCQKLEPCEAVAALKSASNSAKMTALTHLLQERIKNLRTTCEKKDLAAIVLPKQTDISDMTCLECFLFKDLLKFVNQNFFGGWLEETIYKFLQSIDDQLGFPLLSNADPFIEILFQALRQSEGAIWQAFAVKSFGCPLTFDDLNKQCCSSNCPPP